MIPCGGSIESVHCGWSHTVFLCSPDTPLISMGRNDYGQLGRFDEKGILILQWGYKLALEIGVGLNFFIHE